MLPRGDSFRAQAAKARRGSKGGKLAAKRMTKAQRVASLESGPQEGAEREGAEREGAEREGAEREGDEEDFDGGK
jgi:hypothetical protein